MLFRLAELQRLEVVLLLKLGGIFITLLVWQPFSKPKKKTLFTILFYLLHYANVQDNDYLVDLKTIE